MKLLRNLRFLFILIVLILFRPQVGLAQPATVVRVSPAETVMAPNTTAEIEIWVDDVEDLWAFSITIQFDPEFIEVVDADALTSGVQVHPGDFLESDLPLAVVVINQVDNASGVIEFGISQFQDEMDPSLPTAKNGSGVLIHFSVLAKNVLDETDLNISAVFLSDRNGTEIGCSHADGLVVIDGKKGFDVFIPLFIR